MIAPPESLPPVELIHNHVKLTSLDSIVEAISPILERDRVANSQVTCPKWAAYNSISMNRYNSLSQPGNDSMESLVKSLVELHQRDLTCIKILSVCSSCHTGTS